jgi:hypothetical protein
MSLYDKLITITGNLWWIRSKIFKKKSGRKYKKRKFYPIGGAMQSKVCMVSRLHTPCQTVTVFLFFVPRRRIVVSTGQ